MDKVFDYLDAHAARFVRELRDYVRFPSVSAQPAHKKDMEACAQWINQHCQGIGLKSKVYPTEGHPVVMAGTPRRRGRPHFMVYGHYDVQPVEPLDLWHADPFEARIQGRSFYARGASDNKGQHFAHLKAVEAFIKTGTELPVDLTFVLEGEEEVGSGHLPAFLKKHRSKLDCRAVVVSDTCMPDLDHPSLTCGLRGIMALEVTVRGPSRDLHSGLYGGSLENPAMALCQILARLRDERGRILIPGFYDDVLDLSDFERKQIARLPFCEKKYRRFLGVPALHGEHGYSPIEQRSCRPTCEINGLTSGYQGEGSKTIVPSWASAKLTFRLVPNQSPSKILRLVSKHLKSICPPTVRIEVKGGHGGEAYLMSPEDPMSQASLNALREAFHREPVLMREGGSIPIVNQFKKILGVNTLLLGLGLPDDNHHSPNEKIDLDCFARGMVMGVLLWRELAALKPAR